MTVLILSGADVALDALTSFSDADLELDGLAKVMSAIDGERRQEIFFV